MLSRLKQLYSVASPLRSVSLPVTTRRLVSPSFHGLATALFDRLDYSKQEELECGYSAPQVGQNYRVICARISHDGRQRMRMLIDNLSEETRVAARQADAAMGEGESKEQAKEEGPDPMPTEEFINNQMISISNSDPYIMINPTILSRSSTLHTHVEDCLSVKEAAGRVTRPFTIDVQFLNRIGQVLSARLHGLDARVVQHEVDHLDGILFIDHIKEEKDIIVK